MENNISNSELYKTLTKLEYEKKRTIATMYILVSKDWMSKLKLKNLISFLNEKDNDIIDELIWNLEGWQDVPLDGFVCKLFPEIYKENINSDQDSCSISSENVNNQINTQDEASLKNYNLNNESLDLMWIILLYFINFSILHEKKYDSRMRTSLFKLANYFKINSFELTLKEYRIGIELNKALKSSKFEIKNQTEDNFLNGEEGEIKNLNKIKSSSASSGRWWKLGGISLIGGGVIAVVGGISAPIIIPAIVGVLGLVATGGALLGIGAGVAAVTGAVASIITFGGIPLIAGIFGVTGGGLAAYMADYRFIGLSHFKFTKILNIDQAMILHSIEDVNKVENTNEKLEQKIDFQNEKKLQQDLISKNFNDHKGLNVFISISGCLNYKILSSKRGNKEFSDKWIDICSEAPFAEHYVLEWEPKVLSALGHAIRDFVVSYAGKQIFKIWLAAVSTTVSSAYSALMAPLFTLSVFKAINNPWAIAIDRAKKAGKVLAQVLRDRVHGNRPVTLVGLGIGALVIFRALEILSQFPDTFGIVENVYLIGAAISTHNVTKWSIARSLVSGRFVNAYCTKDWILGIIFRGLELSLTAAGVSSVDHSNIENICLDDICNGYSSYEDKETFKKVLKRLKLNEGIMVENENITNSDKPFSSNYSNDLEIDEKEIESEIKKFEEFSSNDTVKYIAESVSNISQESKIL